MKMKKLSNSLVVEDDVGTMVDSQELSPEASESGQSSSSPQATGHLSWRSLYGGSVGAM